MLEHQAHHPRSSSHFEGFTLIKWIEGVIAFWGLLVSILIWAFAFVAPVVLVLWLSTEAATALGVSAEIPWMLLSAILFPVACFWVFWFSFRMMIPIYFKIVRRVGFIGLRMHKLSINDAHDLMRDQRLAAFADFDRLKGRFSNNVQ